LITKKGKKESGFVKNQIWLPSDFSLGF
jgi:hypothetical protein